VTAFPARITEDNGAVSLIALDDVVALSRFPAVHLVWFFVEVELVRDEIGREIMLSVEVQDPDGVACYLQEWPTLIPREEHGDAPALTWSFVFDVDLPVARPGPYVFRLAADGSPVSGRTLHLMRR